MAAMCQAVPWLLGIAVLVSGCATLETDLAAAHALYRDAHYEAAERWLLEVEESVQGLTPANRARFYYLRGMSAYRLGHREDARHYLVLGSELLRTDDSEVDAEGRGAMERALADLLDARPDRGADAPEAPTSWRPRERADPALSVRR